MSLQLYNTDTRKIEPFTPLVEDQVKMYCCGPTVYNYAHVGNLRTYLNEDILRRVIRRLGFNLTHVMNITDVGHLTDDADEGEDKMEKQSRESGMSVWDIAEKYTTAFFEDSAKLHILRPEVTPKATDHIAEMIALVQRLEKNGFTYQAGGNVYFDTMKYAHYGKMAMLEKQELRSGARIDVDTNKKHPRDFVLWFTQSKFENQVMQWDSPWGRGYPGWHLECSAMSMKYLGESFDIHCGGIDHVSVHHTNEIAQSEAATGKKWVNYWVHNEFLLDKEGKMSKSSGNFATLQSLIDRGYHPLDFRYFCISAHYRSQLVYSEDSLQAAKTARKNLFSRVLEMKKNTVAAHQVTGRALKYVEDFMTACNNDLMMPQALAEMWGLIKNDTIEPEQKLAALYDMDHILGFDLSSVEEEAIDSKVQALILERDNARAAKDYALSDSIRDQLLDMGIILEDSPDGTKWKRKL
jgi:cysteinyl-tRNA synthetase